MTTPTPPSAMPDPAYFQQAAELVDEWDARAVHAIIRDGQRTAVDPRDLLRELIARALSERDAEIARLREGYRHCHCPIGVPILDGVCQRCRRVIAGCD